MKRRTYYTLLVRDGRASDWQIHFGDYDKSVVIQEQADICVSIHGRHGRQTHDITTPKHRKLNTKIIATFDRQGDIDDAVRALNAPFDPPFTVIHMTPDNVDQVHNTIADALGEPKLNDDH